VHALLGFLMAAAVAAPPTGLEHEAKPQFGDLDSMLERRVVRVLVPYSRTLYFNDRGAQRGLTADTLRDFEVFLNKKYPKKVQPIVVAPTAKRSFTLQVAAPSDARDAAREAGQIVRSLKSR